jgi:hypothetical protein
MYLSNREFLGKEFYIAIKKEFDNARHYLKTCGKLKPDIILYCNFQTFDHLTIHTNNKGNWYSSLGQSFTYHKTDGDVLKVTYDSVTGELKAVELIK